MLSLKERICGYLGTWLLISEALVWWAIRDSQLHTAVDPSSMAWVGFLPFLLPFFFMQAGTYLVPAIVIFEIVLWIVRKVQ